MYFETVRTGEPGNGSRFVDEAGLIAVGRPMTRASRQSPWGGGAVRAEAVSPTFARVRCGALTVELFCEDALVKPVDGPLQTPLFHR